MVEERNVQLNVAATTQQSINVEETIPHSKEKKRREKIIKNCECS